MGHCGIAITDHESLSAHISAIHCADKVRETNPDFKLILGNEIYLINESEYREAKKFYHFILLAKDAIGHRQLRELSTRAWSRIFTKGKMERVPTFYGDLYEVVGANRGHIIASTACLGGYLPHLLLSGNTESAWNVTQFWLEVFGQENFFVELQPGIADDQKRFNVAALEFCKQHGLRWIITNDVHYLTKDKEQLFSAFLKSHDEERETASFYESTYFKTETEMLQRMDYIDKEDVLYGFQNTVTIANMVETYSLAQNVIVPKRPLPTFELEHLFHMYYGQYAYIKHYAESEEPQDRYLLYSIEKGFKEKKQAFNTENLARINVELEQLWKVSAKLEQRLSCYYNLTRLLIDIMWDDTKGNSLVGVARGSVTGFYICYLTDITQVNPIIWNLPFWRHISEHRPELPDIDVDSQSSQRPHIFEAFREEFGAEHCLNIVTFKRETSKAAVLTACRGLGIDTDIARDIAAAVPMIRGHVWTIDECLYGNEENGFQPVKEFVNKIKAYPMLLETVQEIENLVCGRSSHASGFYLFNNHFLEQNSMMVTPKGIKTTCWDMKDSDECGALKVDILTVEGLDRIRKTMDLLLEDGQIEWQGNLHDTYNRYLHPNVLDYDSTQMWDMLSNNEIINVFQFDTLVGSEAIKKIKPANLREMALANSVMRLTGDESGSPIDRFVAFKNDISLWYKEMDEHGLNPSEVKVLEKYLLANYGNSIEQEDVMELTMDEQIAGFGVVEANKLRKGIAKKKADIIENTKNMFFEAGLKRGTRQLFLDYVWDCCVKPQLGYSFSRNHTLPYSCIGLQEMNLAYKYPILYWNIASLTINASANEDIEDNKSTNYGKIASAIGDVKSRNIPIALPNINTAKFGFTPDIDNNQIVFGLKGIHSVGDDVVKMIIENRPYTSFKDFLDRVSGEIGNVSMIKLVKAGCFDSFNPDRKQVMQDYLAYMVYKNTEDKKALTLTNVGAAIDLNIVPQALDSLKRLFLFRKYILQKQFTVDFDGNKMQVLDDSAQIYFEGNLLSVLPRESYGLYENRIAILPKSFEKWYKKEIIPLKEWVLTPETLSLYNKEARQQKIQSLWDKYCEGDIPKWEMDALSFYYGEHELSPMGKNRSKYNLENFNFLPEEPEVESTKEYTDKKSGETKQQTRFKLCRIAGTVLDKNPTKHTVTLLTLDGVVTVKFYDGAFAHYNKQVSAKLGNADKKTVLEKSWFTRGNLLLVTGFRRNGLFYPRRYFDSVYQHTVCLITNVHTDGTLDLKYEREKG